MPGLPAMPGMGMQADQAMLMQYLMMQNNAMLNPGFFGLGGVSGMPNALGLVGGMPIPGMVSSAAQFHQPAEKNQIKLFVGGLGFQTTEAELMGYFQEFGKVENTIVMRDKATGRGRGFGFVLVSFRDENEAKQKKDQILNMNKNPGHMI